MNARALNRLLEGPPTNLIYKTSAFNADVTMHLRPIVLALSGGFTVTLPKAVGQGLSLTFYVGIISTTGYVFNTNGTDVLAGFVDSNTSGSTPATAWWTSTANKTLTLNGTTTGGGLIGDTITLVDILSGKWAVAGAVTNTGSVATPFSN